jgi:uncharacterized protein
VPSRLRTRNKRPTRPRRFPRFSARRFGLRIYAYAFAAILACGILVALYFNARRQSTAPKRVTRTKTKVRVTGINAQAVVRQLQSAMERRCGFGIWIKDPAAGSTLQGGSAGEVLAVPSVFGTLLSVARGEAEKEGWQARFTEFPSSSRWRSVELEVLRGNEPVCRWRLREVPQIRRAAIIIDDLGADLRAERQLLQLRYPLTFSVMPNLRHSTQIAEEGHRAGREIMLHLPMQPEPGSSANPSPHELEVGMTSLAVRRTIEADLASVPYAAGVNNHMGSRATADSTLMTEVMQVLGERHLYFVDSRTTRDSVALEVARRMQLPAFYRSVFLDDTETTAYTLGQLRELRRVLEEQGTAIAIGHPHPSTISGLAQFLPELEKDDIQLLPASQLVLLPEAARLWPGRSRPVQARNATPTERRQE